MNVNNVTDYFQNLSQLFLKIEVTDQNQTPISLEKGTAKAIEIIFAVKAASKKAMLIGNGGSAAMASHLQSDLCKGVGVRAMVFNEPPLLMALSNDIGYEVVFEEPLKLWADKNDLLFAISSSGQSKNILRGVETAVHKGSQVITLSGFDQNNPLRRMGHLNFYVPSPFYGYVETTHTSLMHFFIDACLSDSPSK